MHHVRLYFKNLIYMMREREKLDIMTMIEFDRSLNDGRLSWESIAQVIHWILRFQVHPSSTPDWKLELIARRTLADWEIEEQIASERRTMKFIQRLRGNY